MYHNQVGFSSEKKGWFNNLINILNCINVLKGKIHMIISIDAEKSLWQNPVCFQKSPREDNIGRNIPQHSKGYAKPMSNIIINIKKSQRIPTKIRNKTAVYYPHSFSL